MKINVFPIVYMMEKEWIKSLTKGGFATQYAVYMVDERAQCAATSENTCK